MRRLFDSVIPSGLFDATNPVGKIVLGGARSIPLVALLGFAAALLEGFGVGLLVPMAALLFGGLEPAAIPGVIVRAMDVVTSVIPGSQAFALGVFVTLLMATKGVLQFLNTTLCARIETRILHDVRSQLTMRTLDLDYQEFLQISAPRIMQILTTDTWALGHATRAALALIPALVALAVYVSVLIWLDWRLFLVVVIAVVLGQRLFSRLEAKQKSVSEELVPFQIAFTRCVLSIVNGARTIRLFGQKDRERAQLIDASREISAKLYLTRKIRAAFTPVMELMLVGLLISLVTIAHSVGISLAELTIFLIILLRCQPNLYVASHSRIAITAERGAISEIEWLLGLNAKARELPPGAPIARIDAPIRFENVSFHYPDGTPAATDLNFEICPGESVAIVGGSGAGKSTIINLLCRLVDPDAGRILLGDRDAASFSKIEWRAHIAAAGQDIPLIEGTIASNISYGRPDAARAEIEQAAAMARAHSFIMQLPEGYDSYVADGGANLSGGQRQRIGLARALLIDPDILILDEALSAVDSLTANEITDLITNHRKGRTTVVISHRKSALQMCSKAVVIKNGRVEGASDTEPLKSLEQEVP